MKKNRFHHTYYYMHRLITSFLCSLLFAFFFLAVCCYSCWCWCCYCFRCNILYQFGGANESNLSVNRMFKKKMFVPSIYSIFQNDQKKESRKKRRFVCRTREREKNNKTIKLNKLKRCAAANALSLGVSCSDGNNFIRLISSAAAD